MPGSDDQNTSYEKDDYKPEDINQDVISPALKIKRFDGAELIIRNSNRKTAVPISKDARKHLIQIKAYRQGQDGVLKPERPVTSEMPGTLIGTIGSHSTIQDVQSPEKVNKCNISFDS